MEDSKLNICLVGAGRMGRIRAKIIYGNPEAKLVAVISKFSGIPLAETYSLPRFETLDDLPKNVSDDIDAFVVTNGTSDHSATIEWICNHKFSKSVSIFIEKPVAGDAKEIHRLFNLCKSAGIKLCCGFQRRFDHSYVAVKEELSKKIGNPTFARVFFADHPVPPVEFLLKDGDPFMDLTPHDIDFVRWCLNDEVESVSAMGSSTLSQLRAAGVLDNIVVNIKFKKGCIVNMYCSRSCSYGYDQRCEFFGPGGRIEVENQNLNSMKAFTSSGQSSSTLLYSFPERFRQAFESELLTFFSVCKGEEEWPISEKDCAVTQQIAMAASEACKMGKIVNFDEFITRKLA